MNRVCLECKREIVVPSIKRHEDWLVVQDNIWKSWGYNRLSGCLCPECMEKMIGRKFRPDELKPVVMNLWYLKNFEPQERQEFFSSVVCWLKERTKGNIKCAGPIIINELKEYAKLYNIEFLENKR